MKELRYYQANCINELGKEIKNGTQRIILQAPVGAGKTFLVTEILRLLAAPSLATAHRKELLDQMQAEVENNNIAHLVQVKSIQMIARQDDHYAVQIIVVDECHRTEAESYKELIQKHPNAIVIGLTATPQRLDGKSLMKADGGTYDKIIKVATVKELARYNFIMLPDVYSSAAAIDLKGIKTIAGDYSKKDLDDRFNTPKLCGDIVKHYKKLAKGRQSLVFAIGVSHANSLRERFEQEGIHAKCVFGTHTKEARDEIIGDFRNKEFPVLINVDLCTEGWDYPGLECVILACPTKSRVKYIQAVGRCMRPAPGKQRPVILDHGGCVYRHGLPEDDWDDVPRERGGGGEPLVKRCPVCELVQAVARRTCAKCGHSFFVNDKEYKEVDEDLVLIQGGAKKKVKAVRKPKNDTSYALRVNMRPRADGCVEWVGPFIQKRPILKTPDGKQVYARNAVFAECGTMPLGPFDAIRMTCQNVKCVAIHHMEKRDLRAIAS